jgi:hypothetical protein
MKFIRYYNFILQSIYFLNFTNFYHFNIYNNNQCDIIKQYFNFIKILNLE